MYFVSVDSPHLGNVDQTQGLDWLFSKMVLDLTGRDLLLQSMAVLETAPSSDDRPVLLKMCDPYFLEPLALFASRTVFSTVPARKNSVGHGSPPKPLSTKASLGNLAGETLGRKGSIQRKNSNKYRYHSGGIRKGEFPFVTIDASTSLPSLILDDRKTDLTAEPEEMISDYSDSTSHSVEDQIISALDQMEWVRLNLIPGKIDLDLTNPSFWTMKQSVPLVQSILSIFKVDDGDTLRRSSTISSRTSFLKGSSTRPISLSLDSLDLKQQPEVHFVVLIHGLEGYNTDMEFIGSKLKERFPGPSLRLIAPECNHGKTHNGIMAGAKGILLTVMNEIKRCKATKIYFSVIGHSLGGLYARCLVGLMLREGLFEPSLRVPVIPMNYISLATPHLASRSHAKILGEKFTALVLGSAIGQTGSDEGGSNREPFVVELSRPKYTDALKLFKAIITYSNVRHDVPVPYSTAAIRLGNFETPVYPGLKYPVILFDSNDEPLPSSDSSYESIMLRNLLELPWKRYAVITDRPLLAHEDIIIKSVFWNKPGYPIIAHIVDHFRHIPEPFQRNSLSGPELRPSAAVSESTGEVYPAGSLDSALDARDGKGESLDERKVHLIIVLHGMNGVARDMLHLVESIRDQYPRPFFKVVAPHTNNQFTTDGIFNGAVRLFSWIKAQIVHSRADRISFVSQGFGGLYARCVVGLLFRENVIPHAVVPVNFITIDTPHLGIISTRVRGDWMGSKSVKPFVTKSGIELSLMDQSESSPGAIKDLMSREYTEPLGQFANLVLYCCTVDPLVSLESGLMVQGSAEVMRDKFWRIVLVKEYQSLAKDIGRLPWKRYAITPPKSISPASLLYWNDDPPHPLMAHIVDVLHE
ncbi:hypothetical protein HDU91_005299 [Kappamyces sp. JEL0680]|nr:hypothetical protein HDU91_005299 [Kappamyces sp. JEL0680]